MADRLHNDLELPDAGAAAPAPDAGYIQWQGLNGRPIARNSGGTIFDLAGEFVDTAGQKITDRVLVRYFSGVVSGGDGAASIDLSEIFSTVLFVSATLVSIPGAVNDRFWFSSWDLQSGPTVKLQFLRGNGVFLGGSATRVAANGSPWAARIEGIPV